MKVSELIDAAATSFETEGWCQHSLYFGRAACSVGAIDKVALQVVKEQGLTPDEVSRLRREAMKAIAIQWKPDCLDECEADSPDWVVSSEAEDVVVANNDNPDTTKSVVLEKFRAAADFVRLHEKSEVEEPVRTAIERETPVLEPLYR